MHSRLAGLLFTVLLLMVPTLVILWWGGFACGAAALFFTLPMSVFTLWDFLDAERKVRRRQVLQGVGFAVTPVPVVPLLAGRDAARRADPPAEGTMSLGIELVTAVTDDVRALIGELDAELAGPYPPENRHGLSIDRVFQPGVMFFIARLDGQAAGCGGIAFEDGFGEVKRMYVRPSFRGRGVARAILARLEQEARARGVKRLMLETGDAQHAAIRLYERAGFTRRAAFGAYASMPPPAVAHSMFFEKGID